jgi:4-hydroxy-tetrahydrodipicolinate synthase
MNPVIPNGVWPTMITPFTNSDKIDYNALERLIEWYLERKVDGLFTTCKSSEMFYLTLEERLELTGFVRERAGGRVPAIASGNISDTLEEQIREVKAMAETGIEAVVLVTNRFALKGESDDVWKSNVEKLLNETVGISLGLYECPYPYKRLLNPELLRWCISTDRFHFIKDTCCDLNQIKAKAETLKDSRIKLFNANAATLLGSLRFGVAGYTGVMANFHPQLYVWLTKNWTDSPREAEKLQNFLGMASVIEQQFYPVNAKYFLQLEGLGLTLNCRTQKASDFTSANRLEVEEFRALSIAFSREYCI